MLRIDALTVRAVEAPFRRRYRVEVVTKDSAVILKSRWHTDRTGVEAFARDLARALGVVYGEMPGWRRVG